MTMRARGVTDAELAILKVLWERESATIRELTDVLYPEGGSAHYATVQKLLERLQAKGCVSRRPDGRAHIYSATIAREELITHRLRDTAEKLCGGSLTPLLTQLVGDSDLSETTWCAYAFPASYSASGSRTFFVNQAGDITATDDAQYEGKDAVEEETAGSAFIAGGSVKSITGRVAIGTTGRDGNLWRRVN